MVLDAGYSLLNMDVSTGILDLFEFSGEPDRLRSVYASSIHNLNLAIRATPAQRVRLHLAYNLTKDTGGDDFNLALAERSAFSLEGAYLRTSLPMSYHSPRVRLSVAMKAEPRVELRLAVLRLFGADRRRSWLSLPRGLHEPDGRLLTRTFPIFPEIRSLPLVESGYCPAFNTLARFGTGLEEMSRQLSLLDACFPFLVLLRSKAPSPNCSSVVME